MRRVGPMGSPRGFGRRPFVRPVFYRPRPLFYRRRWLWGAGWWGMGGLLPLFGLGLLGLGLALLLSALW